MIWLGAMMLLQKRWSGCAKLAKYQIFGQGTSRNSTNERLGIEANSQPMKGTRIISA